jgi:5-methyltetrahydropteroyltriglutamate--homocysteine methyltransferase
MQRSTERILTTHVGSLPRPPDLLEMINAKEEGRAFDLSRYRARVKNAVREAVEKQAAAGIDISADGEMGRVGFIPYVNERLSGIEPKQAARGQHQWRRSREYQAFPEYYEWASAIAGAAGQAPAVEWVCTGPIAYRGEALKRDIDNLKEALAGVSHVEAFMPAVSPTQLANWNKNEYYSSQKEYRLAIAEALREEYRRIVDAGVVLQIDDPQLASRYVLRPESAANGRPTASSFSITRSKGSRRSAFAITPATASILGPGSTISNSNTSSTSCFASMPAPIPSKPPIRVTSTNGGSGKA